MKKILPAILFASFGLSAAAQNLKNNVAPANPEVTTSPAVGDNNSEHFTVSPKAVNFIKKTFKNASDVKWYQMPDGYRANFTQDGIRCRLDYDANGNWLHTIRYYDQKKLPLEVRRLVTSTYFDYDIRTVEEIQAASHPTSYIVHLEGQTIWMNVKVSDGEITELEKINKS